MLVASGCGQLGGAEEPDQLSPIERTATDEQFQSDSQTLFDRIRGTTQQRAAAQYLVNHALNRVTRDCMGERGYSWSTARLDNPVPVIFEAFGDTTWLREPMRPVASEQALAAEPAKRAIRRGTPARAPAEDAALDECGRQDQSSLPSDEEMDDIAYGPDVAKLDTEFHRIVDRVDQSLGSESVYTDCMRTKLHDSRLGDDDLPAFTQVREDLLESRIARLDQVPLPGENSSKGWTELLADEQQVLAADSACRSTHYAEGVIQLAPELEKFAAEHADALSQLDTYWRQLLTDARRQGFAG